MITITFPIEPIDPGDESLTCIFCNLHKCTHVIRVLGDGIRVWCGMHEACGERHTKRVQLEMSRPGS